MFLKTILQIAPKPNPASTHTHTHSQCPSKPLPSDRAKSRHETRPAATGRAGWKAPSAAAPPARPQNDGIHHAPFSAEPTGQRPLERPFSIPFTQWLLVTPGWPLVPESADLQEIRTRRQAMRKRRKKGFSSGYVYLGWRKFFCVDTIRRCESIKESVIYSSS